MPWWNCPDSLLPWTVLFLWLWKRSITRTLVSTGFCCGQVHYSSGRDFYFPLQDVLAKVSWYFLENRMMFVPLKSHMNSWIQFCSHLRLRKGSEGRALCWEWKLFATAKHLTVANENAWKRKRTSGYKSFNVGGLKVNCISALFHVSFLSFVYPWRVDGRGTARTISFSGRSTRKSNSWRETKSSMCSYDSCIGT